jgi:hypothetical protein
MSLAMLNTGPRMRFQNRVANRAQVAEIALTSSTEAPT